MGNIARSLLRAFGPRHSSISTGGGPTSKPKPFKKQPASKPAKSLGSPPPPPSQLPAASSAHETPPHQTTHMSDYHLEQLRARYHYWMWVMSVVMVVCLVDVGILDYLWLTWIRNS
ncbi:hypothetical protein HDU86_000680 [Geranomyces michiganensis]|nr:hypothetical protein HDU86_000680 [Geranomyces michiganensis]